MNRHCVFFVCSCPLILFDDFSLAGSTMGWFTKTYDMPKVTAGVVGWRRRAAVRKKDGLMTPSYPWLAAG
jgi:hypothetical protein